MMKGCKLVLRLSGKASRVFRIIELLAKYKGNLTLEELR